MEETREVNYKELKEALGTALAANVTSVLLSSEVFDYLVDMGEQNGETAKAFGTLMSSLLEKSCYTEMLSVLTIFCALTETGFPKELKGIGESPSDLKAFLSELVSDFEDILAQEYG